MHNGVDIRDLNDLEATTSQLPLIGYTVEGIRVSHPDLERVLQSTGFDKYLPDPPTPRVALRRALAEWIKTKQRTGRTLQLQLGDEDQDENGGGRRRTLIRVIDRAGSEHLVYALVAEDVDCSALGLSYGTALRILQKQLPYIGAGIRNGDLALLECRNSADGEPAYAICAVNLIRQSGGDPEIEMVPFGLMFSRDPFSGIPRSQAGQTS